MTIETRAINYIDITGQRFGRLLVLEQFIKRIHGRNISHCSCLCDCGNKKIIRKNGLIVKHGTKSCGCILKEVTARRSFKHGCSRQGYIKKVYSVWRGMLNRCTNSRYQYFNNYGGRGITVCKKWYQFKNFYQDMKDPPSSTHSLDRINNNKGYCKKNCRWTTGIEQGSNKRNNRLITFNGKTQTLAQWARDLRFKEKTLTSRIVLRKWNVKRAFTQPLRQELRIA